MVCQGAEVSGAAVSLANLSSRLHTLITKLVQDYSITDSDLEVSDAGVRTVGIYCVNKLIWLHLYLFGVVYLLKDSCVGVDCSLLLHGGLEVR